jgi:hypothetical protein
MPPRRADRTLAVAVILSLAGLGTAFGLWRWPDQRPALECEPALVHLDDAGVARCGAGGALPAGQALTLGLALDLNRASAEELALVPQINGELARRLVETRTRLGGFRSWAEVDAVEGVGNVRLARLREHCRLETSDAGV